MKKLIYYTLGLVLAMGTQSCDDWLDVKPLTSIPAKDLFKTEAGFKDALAGVYINMSSTGSYGREMSFGFVEVLSQQYTLPSGNDYYQTSLFNYNNKGVISKKDAVWDAQYNILSNINLILDNIENGKEVMSDLMYRMIKGECLGLRAFIHLDLMRLYGYGNLAGRGAGFADNLTIPYAQHYTKELIPQNSYKTTIALIENDLEQALELLRADPVVEDDQRDEDMYERVNEDGFLDNRRDRFNYYAARATQARLYQWIGDYANALEAAEDVIDGEAWSWIQESTISNSDLRQRDMTFSTEHIFSLRQTAMDKVVNYYVMIDQQTTSTDRYLRLSKPAYETLYESAAIGRTDYRYQYLYDVQGELAIPIKFIQREGGNAYYINRIPMLTISEMYFIAAEAMLKGERRNPAKAREYIDKHRTQRAILTPLPEGADEQALLEELDKEVRKEWIGEGRLFFEYKRRGLSNIPGTALSSQIDDKKYVVPYPEIEVRFGSRVQFYN